MKTKKQNPPKGGKLTEEQIKWLNKCTEGTWKLNHQTGLVDVEGDFDCNDRGLSDFKGVRFGVVERHFSCSDNRLTSLEGAPRKVGGDFWCENNRLTSLEGAPRKVGGDFDCGSNRLTSLEGAPEKVEGNFWCRDNQLTSLVGAPREVGAGFNWSNNPVSEKTLKRIFGIMKTGKGYLESVESLWMKIPLEDQTLLYRPEFEWVEADEVKKLDALRAYQGFKGMI